MMIAVFLVEVLTVFLVVVVVMVMMAAAKEFVFKLLGMMVLASLLVMVMAAISYDI